MWRWATEKAARFPRVRIRHDPAAGRTGSVLEIIDIERPFQMDSIVAELSEQGHVAVAIFPAVVPDGWDPAERESADPGAQLRFVQILLPVMTEAREIGRAHVCTPVTNAQLVCRL